MNIQHLDLNLLHIFSAVYVRRSVVSAAQVLGISQPAVERALTTLRIELNDPLFVSAPNGLAPTATARTIGRRVTSVLQTIDGAMGEADVFNPTTSTRKFSICISEVFALDLVPKIVKVIADSAPGVRLELQAFSNAEIWPVLADGRIEFAVGYFPGGVQFDQMRVFEDRYALLVSNRHPMRDRSASREDLANLRLALVDGDVEVADWLHQLDVAANFRVTVSSASMLPTVLNGSDTAAILPSRTARIFAANGPLRVVNIDPEFPSFPISIIWKWRASTDSGSRWLRHAIRDVTMTASSREAPRKRSPHRTSPH